MSKKNKDIEVRMEETKKSVNGQEIEVTQLFIGKKMIGEIFTNDAKHFEIYMDNESQGVTKTFGEAVESVIRQWNLHD
ncbi:hypothetical protein BAU15_04305 [Enterococcus sp. JM4C]|uniref:DUF2969 domain-containing protein n=1 Tax=Candidatus Enterococcus huntleyi TaxID=1857217 RepID=UPI00137A2EC9|nr:DUF2969 domain-containing protein [Enterococcus sp. JM4C]KAF1295764.1 hypothetical protein BAU15_04305 [Enterococcus sp. JM4C]